MAIIFFIILLIISPTRGQNYNEILLSDLPDSKISYKETKIVYLANGDITIHIACNKQIFINNSKNSISVLQLKINNKFVFAQKLNYRIQKPYLSKAYFIDLDNNGVEDLVIFSYPLGASGKAANINRVTCIILGDKEYFSIVNYSSFYASIENFIDFNDDKLLEFVCVNNYTVLKSNNKINYYIRNIFNLKKQNVTSNYNISKVYCEKEDKLKICDKKTLPNTVIFFNKPNVIK